MSGVTHTLVIVLLVALFTFFTRLFPFVVFGRKGEPSHGQTAGRPAAPFCHRHLGHLLLKKHNL